MDSDQTSNGSEIRALSFHFSAFRSATKQCTEIWISISKVYTYMKKIQISISKTHVFFLLYL